MSRPPSASMPSLSRGTRRAVGSGVLCRIFSRSSLAWPGCRPLTAPRALLENIELGSVRLFPLICAILRSGLDCSYEMKYVKCIKCK